MNVEVQLAQLESAGLVRSVGGEESTYIFKHALTQDAAYQSVLLKERREIHRRVAQAYEAQFREPGLDAYAGILAQHYAQAGDDEQALVYAARAGDLAARVYANAEAIAYYGQAIQFARGAKTSPPMRRTLLDLYLKAGRAYELSNQYDAALDQYSEMETVARERDDREMELASLIARATIYSIPSPRFDRERSKVLCDQALASARAIGDEAAEAKVLWNLLLANSRLEMHYREAVAYGEQGVAIARRLKLREQLAYLLNDISLLYALNGNPELGMRCNLESREMWRALGNLPMLADNLGYATMEQILLAEYPQAIDGSREALEISRRIGNEWGETFIGGWVGEAYREVGQIELAILTMEDTLRLAGHSFQPPLGFTRADLARLYGDLGQPTKGIELARLAYSEGERIAPGMHAYTSATLVHLHVSNGDLALAQPLVDGALARLKSVDPNPLFDTSIHGAEAELYLARGEYGRAIQSCDRAVSFLRASRLHRGVPNILFLKGLAQQGQGNLTDALGCFQDAKSEAERSGSRWMLWRILAALVDIEAGRGQHALAETLQAQSRENLEYIVAHTPDELRSSFLNLRDVRKVRGEKQDVRT